jgi:hypothetical protein
VVETNDRLAEVVRAETAAATEQAVAGAEVA